MIFLLLISCPVLCNASFTKTSRSFMLGVDGRRWACGWKVGHVGHQFPVQALRDKLTRAMTSDLW